MDRFSTCITFGLSTVGVTALLVAGRLLALKVVLKDAKPGERAALVRAVAELFRVRGSQTPPSEESRSPNDGENLNDPVEPATAPGSSRGRVPETAAGDEEP